MVKRFHRSVKINARRSQGKLIVFIAGINSAYAVGKNCGLSGLAVETRHSALSTQYSAFSRRTAYHVSV